MSEAVNVPDSRFPPRLIVGSSEHATTFLADLVGHISLCVTSPPYHNAISYDAHQRSRAANYRERESLDYADEYLPLLQRVWNECHALLKPSGYLAVNVGTVLDGGYHYPLPQDIARQLVESLASWRYCRSIMWNKVTAGVKRAGSVIQHRLPGYFYPNLMTEHIIVVQKPGPSKRTDRTRSPHVPAAWWENVWDLAPVPPGTVDHPAPFPEDLPHRLIGMFTEPGDWVFDPFNGAGATTKAAFDLGRHSAGIDLSEQYTEYAHRRIYATPAVRPQQLEVRPIRAQSFSPGKSRGKTRHGAGLNARHRQPS